MTDTEALLQELRRIRWSLKGEARNAALEAHLEKVEADGDQPLLNQTLTALVDCYEYSVDSSRLLVPFSRLLRGCDTAPEHFDAALLRSVYWQFEWVVYDLIDHPDIPLASIEHWMGRWRRRYSEAGHPLHPFHEAEHYLAVHLGDRDRAARAAAAVRAAEPDDMSDCEACRAGYLGRIAFWNGEHGAALGIWRPLFDGDLHCMHEPHKPLGVSPHAAAAVGRLDQARADHVRGYEMRRGEDDMTAYVAAQMRFCAQTGNEARPWPPTSPRSKPPSPPTPGSTSWRRSRRRAPRSCGAACTTPRCPAPANAPGPPPNSTRTPTPSGASSASASTNATGPTRCPAAPS